MKMELPIRARCCVDLPESFKIQYFSIQLAFSRGLNPPPKVCFGCFSRRATPDSIQSEATTQSASVHMVTAPEELAMPKFLTAPTFPSGLLSTKSASAEAISGVLSVDPLSTTMISYRSRGYDWFRREERLASISFSSLKAGIITEQNGLSFMCRCSEACCEWGQKLP